MLRERYGEANARKIALMEQRRARRARSKKRFAFWAEVAARIKNGTSNNKHRRADLRESLSGCIRAREPQVLRAPRTVKAGAAAPASAVIAVRRVVALMRAPPPGAGEGDHVAPLRRKRRAHQSCDRNQASVSSERRPQSCHVGPAPRGGDQLLPIGRPLAQAPERLRTQPTETPTRQPERQEAANPGERRVTPAKQRRLQRELQSTSRLLWRTSAKTRMPIVSAEKPSTIMAP